MATGGMYMEEEEREDSGSSSSIYKISRQIKRNDHQSLYNSLRSIFEDSKFVHEIRALWPDLPLLANLRCGLWYSPSFDNTCYFKSTDGHAGNWSFNPSRLNLHVAHLAAERGGCFIVDATRHGKRFPDSFSKTIPIWACVLNRAVNEYRNSEMDALRRKEQWSDCLSDVNHEASQTAVGISTWDCKLHLPLWVSENEKENIEKRVDTWVNILHAATADIGLLSKVLKKPLQPLWISQKTVIWLNEVPDAASWSFTPIILVSASQPFAHVQRMTDGNSGWSYIPGAADDEESWARGLTPCLFWKHAVSLMNSSGSACNRMVADIVERDRVSRAYKGHYTNQVRAQYTNDVSSLEAVKDPNMYEIMRERNNNTEIDQKLGFYRIIDTKLAIGNNFSGQPEGIVGLFDCVINCGTQLHMPLHLEPNAYLYLSVMDSKHDRFSLLNNLHHAIIFARENLKQQRTMLIMCTNGEDLSVCVCLTILLMLFNGEGGFDDGLQFKQNTISKWDVRQRLVYLCKFVPNARPSRGNLRQVYNFVLNYASKNSSNVIVTGSLADSEL